MKIQKFSAIIKDITYTKVEKSNNTFYVANTQISEIGRGVKPSKIFDNAKIYLTEQDFNNKKFAIGDRISLNDNIRIVRNVVELRCYDSKKLKKYKPSKLKRDERNRTYGINNVVGYTFSCPIGSVSLTEKAGKSCHININGVVFYIQESEINAPYYTIFYNSKEDYDKLKPLNMQDVNLTCYLHKNAKWCILCEVQTAYDEDSSQYFINIIKKEY